MLTTKNLTSVYLLLVVFLLIGSAQVARFSAQEFVPSGFMKHYPEFKPSPDGKAMGWRDQSVNFKRFDKIAILPITIWYHPDAKYRGIKPKKLAAITTRLENRLSQTFAKKFKVVNKPGPNVLVIRAAITNVVIKKLSIFKKNHTDRLGCYRGTKDRQSRHKNIKFCA